MTTNIVYIQFLLKLIRLKDVISIEVILTEKDVIYRRDNILFNCFKYRLTLI